MARVLCVTLSIEWQCEQFACANALPARTFGSALHRVAVTNRFNAITTDDMILCLICFDEVSLLFQFHDTKCFLIFRDATVSRHRVNLDDAFRL